VALQDPRAPAQQKSQIVSLQPPVGGWNTRDAYPLMPPTDAVIMDNMLPQPWQVTTRLGATSWVSGFGANINTLMPFNSSIPGSRRMFAAVGVGAGTAIYNVTTAGSPGAAAVSGLTNSWFQWVNFGTQAGQFLVAVNGADSMQTYNGTAWTATATLSITGGGNLNLNTIVGIGVYENTLYFIPNNTLGFYYQAPQSIFGTATYFSLAALAPRGGYLQAIATWTVDGGMGPQDYLVCITSEGEFIIFQGASFATAFGTAGAMTLVGVYYIARPLGRRCWMKYGGDCLVLTERGLFPLSLALQSATVDKRVALSDKIEPTFVSLASQTYDSTNDRWQGWQLEMSQHDQFLLVHVPSSPPQQLVMQFQTKGWARWLGWNANCFLYTNGSLYYADNQNVYLAYTGTADLGTNTTGQPGAGGLWDGANSKWDQCLWGATYSASAITSTLMPAFSQLKMQGQQKHVKLVRPYLQSTAGIPSYTIGSVVDYNPFNITTTTEPGINPGSPGVWDTGKWDLALWGSSIPVQSKLWHTVLQYPGFAFAPYWQWQTNYATIALTAYDVLYAPGGVL
jgi:hypothetical protein